MEWGLGQAQGTTAGSREETQPLPSTTFVCVCVCVCVCVPNSLRTWLRGTGLVGRLQSPRHPESRVFLPTCMPEKHKQNSVLCAPMLQAYPRDSDVEEEK